MNQPIQSRNMEEVAALPLKLNLQLFAGTPDDPEPDLDMDPDEPEGLEWESFDSDKPKSDEPEEPEKPEVVTPEPEKPKQDPETNRAFQEMRKAKEEAERKAKAADEWVKQNYGDQGITTWEQYQAAVTEQKKRQEYEEKGIDYDAMRKIAKEEAENHPDVVKSRQTAQAEAIQAEISAFNTAHPDAKIDSVEDITKLSKSDEIIQRIQKGYTLKEAYEIVHQDEIIAKRIAAAAQAERNKLNSKTHLKPNSTGAPDEAISVPDDVMKSYERMFSKELRSGKMTREDIVKHYKRSAKG